MAALAAQTGVGNASAFVGRVPAAIVGAPADWNLTADSAFVLAFAGGDLPNPAAAFAVYTNVTTCNADASAGVREACGGADPGEMACLALGCCFDEQLNVSGVPRCYVAQQPPQGPHSKQCPAAERADCGFNGIGPDECQTARGCCWAANPGGGPQCFFPVDGRVGGPLNISFAVAPAADDACFRVRDVFGFDRGQACASAGVLTVSATDGPTYFL